jgi:hypothetical protein
MEEVRNSYILVRKLEVKILEYLGDIGFDEGIILSRAK